MILSREDERSRRALHIAKSETKELMTRSAEFDLLSPVGTVYGYIAALQHQARLVASYIQHDLSSERKDSGSHSLLINLSSDSDLIVVGRRGLI